MCKPTVVTNTTIFNVTSTTAGIILWTPWTLVVGASNLRIVRNIQGSSGSPTTDVGYQFAAVRQSKPGTWSSVSSLQTGDGYKTNNVDVSATTDQVWVRAGLRASATTQGQGQATITLMVDSPARIVAQQTIKMAPTSTAYSTIPLSKPLPLVGMSKAMCIAIYSYEGGTTNAEPVYRLITNDTDAGSTWSDLETTAPSAWTADTEYNSTELTLADDTTKAYWVPGFKYKNTTDGGTLQVIFIAIN